MKKCVRCSNDNFTKTQCCATCCEAARLRTKHRRKQRKDNGICINCPAIATRGANCDNCYGRKEQARAFRDKRKTKGLCSRCSNTIGISRTSLCDVCGEKDSALHKTKRRAHMSNGLCTHCSNPATIGNYCERHWFGARASETARGTSGDAIRKLLINQNYTCPYSGDMLIPGKNASLDHKIPKSRGGTHTVANLQWITLVVNRAKSDLSDAEFIEMCRKVVSKRDTLNFMTKDSNDTAPSTK